METWTEHCTWMQNVASTSCLCVILTTKKNTLLLWSCFSVYVWSSFCFYVTTSTRFNFFCAYPLTHTKNLHNLFTSVHFFVCIFIIMCTINTSKWIWYFFFHWWLLLHLRFFCIYMHSWPNAYTMIDVELFFLPSLSFPSLRSSEWKKRLNITKVQLQPSSTYYLDDCHPKS